MRNLLIPVLTLVACTAFLSANAQAPANDDPCNAIQLPLSANETCSNALAGTTLNATTSTGFGYTNPVECGVASQPKDVWYKVTTTASGPGSTILHFKLSASGANPMTSGNITLLRANGTCPAITMSLLSGACKNSSSGSFTSVTLTVQFLTPNTTYYLRVNPVNDTDPGGTFSICAYLPVATPPCVSYITPGPNATNVPVNEFVIFEWTASPGAVLYDRHLSTSNPPVPTVKSGTATKDSSKFLIYNKKYYWYIAPRNSSGATTGCPVDSFTTAPAPANCIPLTTNNCRTNDTLKLVKLTGENNTSIDNPSGCSPNGYADYTGTTNVTLAQGKAYSGILHASFVHDFFTIWIDYNDDGYFTDNERLLNNLRQQWSAEPTPFTINIPATAATGTHKMRVRNVYHAVNPAVVSGTTDACNHYSYSETEDYSVTIIPAANAPAPVVASGINNNCLQGGATTIDQSTNNNTQLVQVVDGDNDVIAGIAAGGNDLGAVQVTVYKSSGSVRTLSDGTKLLDRNITVQPRFQPSSSVQLRLYITQQELAALQAADPSITGISSLAVTKVDDTCTNKTSGIAGTLVTPVGTGTIGTDYYIDVAVTGFSNFYIHSGNFALPVDIVSFKGQRQKDKVKLEWITATESNNKGFELQRSADGRNFTAFAFIASRALQGNSQLQLQYQYTDEAPMRGSNYYRLKQTDINGEVVYSEVVLVKNTTANGIIFIDMYPNPVRDWLRIRLASPAVNKVDVFITDMTGRVIRQQAAQLIAGDNVVNLAMQGLQAGQYLVKVVCSTGCEGATMKIVKE